MSNATVTPAPIASELTYYAFSWQWAVLGLLSLIFTGLWMLWANKKITAQNLGGRKIKLAS